MALSVEIFRIFWDDSVSHHIYLLGSICDTYRVFESSCRQHLPSDAEPIMKIHPGALFVIRRPSAWYLHDIETYVILCLGMYWTSRTTPLYGLAGAGLQGTTLFLGQATLLAASPSCNGTKAMALILKKLRGRPILFERGSGWEIASSGGARQVESGDAPQPGLS